MQQPASLSFKLPTAGDTSFRLPEMVSPTNERGMPNSSPDNHWNHPNSFNCPISHLCMHDPVLLCDGHSYERHNIEKWIEKNDTSPVTGAMLAHKTIFPNHALRNAIEEYFQQVNKVYLRAIRKTLNSTPSGPGSNGALERTVDAFMQCSLLVHADLSTESVLRKIMDEAKALVGAEVASVFLLDSAQKELYSNVNSTGREIRIPVTQGIAGHVATTGTAIIIRDAYSDDRFNKSVDVKTGLKTRGIMCVPLKTKKEGVIGVVQLINKTSKGVLNTDTHPQSRFRFGIVEEEERDDEASVLFFTEHDLQFLQVFAAQAVMAIANSGMLDEPKPQTPKSADKDMAGKFGECVFSCFGRKSPKHAKHDSGALELAEQMTKATKEIAAQTSEPDVDDEPESDTIGPARDLMVDWAYPQVADLLTSAYDLWQVNTLQLATLTNNKPLSTMGCYLFDRLGLNDSFNLDRTKLRNFMVNIEQGYSINAPYHNGAHAASVLHAMHALMEHGGLGDVDAGIFKGELISASGAAFKCRLQRMTCLFAAAIHDFEHLGLTNDFLVKTHDSRALAYNDKSVNENHHIAASFSVLQRPWCNFLDGIKSLSPESFQQFRQLAIDLVFATDMINNAKIVAALKAAQSPTADEKTKSQKGPLMLQVGIKCADLGHLALDWDTHSSWVQLLEQEFFAQGDLEKALGLQPSFLMDRTKPGPSKTQLGFFDFVVFPLFGTLHHSLPAMFPIIGSLNDNYQMYVAIEDAANEEEEEVKVDASSSAWSSVQRYGDEVANLLSSAHELWQVNTLQLATLTNDKPLSTMGCYLFDSLGLTQSLGLDEMKLSKFMVAIEQGYSRNAPYHSSAHAASVLQAMHSLLEHGAMGDIDSGIFKSGLVDLDGSSLDSRLQRMTCLFAAAIHDFEHLGLTNDFLVKTYDKRALKYNDKHVNENHHIAAAFSVLQRPACNFLLGFRSQSPEGYQQFRQLAIDLVFATDMANNAKIVADFKAAQDLNADEKTKRQRGSLMLQMGIKCADLGHLALDWDTHSTWVQLLEQEFFAQGDQEKALCLQPSFLMDRTKPGPSKSQVGFFSFVVLPLFGALHDAVPAMGPMMDAINDNYNRYLALEALEAEDADQETSM